MRGLGKDARPTIAHGQIATRSMPYPVGPTDALQTLEDYVSAFDPHARVDASGEPLDQVSS